MLARWRAAPRSSWASAAKRSTMRREPFDAGEVPRPSTCPAAAPEPMPMACSAARPSIAGIKPSEPGEALHREALDAADLPRRCARLVKLGQDRCRVRAAPLDMRCARPRSPQCRHGGERRPDQALHREARACCAIGLENPIHSR
jgi:hypothetical protein